TRLVTAENRLEFEVVRLAGKHLEVMPEQKLLGPAHTQYHTRLKPVTGKPFAQRRKHGAIRRDAGSGRQEDVTRRRIIARDETAERSGGGQAIARTQAEKNTRGASARYLGGRNFDQPV